MTDALFFQCNHCRHVRKVTVSPSTTVQAALDKVPLYDRYICEECGGNLSFKRWNAASPAPVSGKASLH